MRIHDQNLNGAAASQTGGPQEVQRTERAGPARTGLSDGDGDRVEFSKTLGALSRALDADRSDRAARVEHLAALYRAGQYRGDPVAAAHAMISEALGAAAG